MCWYLRLGSVLWSSLVSYCCDPACEPRAFSASPTHTEPLQSRAMPCCDDPTLHPHSYSHQAEMRSKHKRKQPEHCSTSTAPGLMLNSYTGWTSPPRDGREPESQARLFIASHKFSTMRVVGHWNRVTKVVVEALSLNILKSSLNGLWATQCSWRWPCLLQGDWTTRPQEVPFNLVK